MAYSPSYNRVTVPGKKKPGVWGDSLHAGPVACKVRFVAAET
jgi:hypothetical protein